MKASALPLVARVGTVEGADIGVVDTLASWYMG